MYRPFLPPHRDFIIYCPSFFLCISSGSAISQSWESTRIFGHLQRPAPVPLMCRPVVPYRRPVSESESVLLVCVRRGGGGGGRLRGTLLALVLPLLVRHTAPTATVRMFDFNLRSKRRENPPSCLRLSNQKCGGGKIRGRTPSAALPSFARATDSRTMRARFTETNGRISSSSLLLPLVFGHLICACMHGLRHRFRKSARRAGAKSTN